MIEDDLCARKVVGEFARFGEMPPRRLQIE
jgi:hypothetical protein